MARKKDKSDEQTELDLSAPAPEKAVESTEAAPSEDEGETLEWVCHPLKRRPLVSVAVTLFVVVVGVLVYLGTASNAFTVLALVVLLASLAKFYFPTRYRLTESGFHVMTTTQKLFREWEMFRTFHPDKNGVLLSPFTRRTRLENFRGYYMMFESNREEVLDFVRRYVKIERAATAGEAQAIEGESK